MIKEINRKEVRQNLVSAKTLKEFKKWQVIYLNACYEVDNHFIARVTGLDVKTITEIIRKFRMPADEKTTSKSNITLKNLNLSKRDIHLIRLICLGKTSVEIGDELGIATRTVEGIRMEMYTKLEITKVAELVVLAVKAKII